MIFISWWLVLILFADVFKMTQISRHKSMDALRGYVRRSDLFEKHAGERFLR